MLTTLFRSQVMDITVNALIEVNGISRVRVKIDRPIPSSYYRHPYLFFSPSVISRSSLSLLLSLLYFAKCFFVNTLYLATYRADVQAEPLPPDYCTQLPPRMKIFSREEKVGRRTETDASGSTNIPFNVARHKERSCINNL